MQKNIAKAVFWIICAFFCNGLVKAQSIFSPPGVPAILNGSDGNGVDVATGRYHIRHRAMSIGPSPQQGGLEVWIAPTETCSTSGKIFACASVSGQLTYQHTIAMDRLGANYDVFSLSSINQTVSYANCTDFSCHVPGQHGGSIPTPVAANTYQYIDRDGVVYTILETNLTRTGLDPQSPDQWHGVVQRVAYPSGVTETLNYNADHSALTSVVSSAGYAIKVEPSGDITSVNMMLSPCQVQGVASCVGQPATETIHIDYIVTTEPPGTYPSDLTNISAFTNAKGQKTIYTNNQSVFAVQMPASTVPDLKYSISYPSVSQELLTVSRPDGVWTYNFNFQTIGATNKLFSATTTVNDPTGVITTVTNVGNGFKEDPFASPKTIAQGSRSWTLSYNSNAQLYNEISPTGSNTAYNIDVNGNHLQETITPPTGSPLAAKTTKASFYGNCASYPAQCNKPQSYTDERGNVTNYTYNTNGFLTNEARPSPDGKSTPIYTNYVYGTPNAPGGGTVELLQIKTEGLGLPEAVTTTYDYSGSPNLLPTAITRRAGALQATTRMTYTPDGDPDRVTDPMGNPTRYYHDALRRVVGVVGPDPDGSGPLLNRATDTSYDGNGRVTQVARGTVTNQGDGAGSSLVPLQITKNTYDPASGVLTRTEVDNGGGTAISATDFTYDAARRPVDTKVELFGQGADRITHNVYSGTDGLLNSITTAFGATDGSSSTVGYTYALNQKMQTLTDGNGHVTRYAYDGFDRLQTATQADNTTDGYAYDAVDNMLTHTLRDGQVISFGYDALNRKVARSATGISNIYSYDGLGRLTGATGGSYNVSRTYDALGNMLTDTTGGFAMNNDYDAAGRRIGERWAATGGAIKFQYSATSEMSAITDANGYGWVSLTYDDLGRRTNAGYLTGRSTSYAYGADLRLSMLTHHMSGGPGNATQNDVAYGFSYNPAGQIVGRTTSNDSYAYSPVPTSAAYTPNALNQLTSSATPFTYDPRGNQTVVGGAPTRSRAFSVDDKLTDAGVGASPHDILGYDALDRLASVQVGTGGAVTRLVWDGDEIAGELDGAGNLQSFYANGPGTNEPMVWYQMPGTIQVFHADERGSIVALTDRSGNIERIHSYDAYGREGAAAHLGRFGYAGGVALPEAGLTHFRARAYDTATGRFISADPIGIKGGINLYEYAGDDPLDATDSNGTEPKPQSDEIVVEGFRKKPHPPPPPPPVLGIIVNVSIAGFPSLNRDIYLPGPGYFQYQFDKLFNNNKPPADATDSDGAKAPGKPGEKEGFKDPKGGPKWVPNPNPGKGGAGYGWQDSDGNVWCPTGPGARAHGGPHWDVQTPGGGYRNVRPAR